MMERLALPKINAEKFARSFILIKVSRQLRNVVETLGVDNISYLIESEKDISAYVPANLEAEYRQRAKIFGQVADIISEEDMFDMLPEWAKLLISKYGDTGKAWFKKQVDWFRTFF